jgi:prolyl oligopeptidase
MHPTPRLVLFLSVLAFLALATLGVLPATADDPPEDPFHWLEEVEGKEALDWVAQRNAESKAEFTKHPAFAEIEANTLAVLEADDRLVVGQRYGNFVYNLWKDAKNSRGLYRRAPYASYLAGTPEWETVLDLDALAEKEGQSWVWKGMDLLRPQYKRGLLRLSPGGSDAAVVREFDVEAKAFVDGGFALPAAKSRMGWVDENHVFVATDVGPGSMTDSGYPRIAKRWTRGTPLAEAETIFEGKKESVAAGAAREHLRAGHIDWVYHNTSFYTSDMYILEGDAKTKMDIPDTAVIHTYFDGYLFIELKRPWTVGEATYEAGTILTSPLASMKAGKKDFQVFLKPTERTSLQGIERTKSYLIVRMMEDVKDQLYRYQRKDDAWERKQIEFEGQGTISTSSMDVDHDDFFVTYSSFLQPTTLFRVDATTLAHETIDQAPARFDATPFTSEQRFATSKDGTQVPYFVVRSKTLEFNGKNRTLLYGYGGFQVSQRPFYVSTMGKNWLERGGVFVLACIRGGGEYGPRWHRAALKENRHKAFEDFEAIAEDLIEKKITTPSYLGIRGGSNGGLLVGAAFTRRPDLYGAVVCSVPLLDMRRFNQLLAGASWMAEYGDPDKPEEWAFLKTYSPYHNLSPQRTYPRVLFTTSTKDDRVHPGHARKMVALMRWMGHPVVYYENTEGGHAGAANAKQRAYTSALGTTYLLTELGD